MKIIDFHTHLLPQMDDGSKSVEESKEMLRREKQMGIDIVAMTPHFYAEQNSIGSFLASRRQAVQQIREIADVDLPMLLIGAEVRFFSHISSAKILDEICFEHSGVLLLEMPFAQWDKSMYQEVERLIVAGKRTVILAHMERYPAFQRDKTVFREVMKLPVIGQCNAASLLNWRRRGQLLRWFKRGQAQLLASDCHNLSTRPPNLKDGRSVIEQRLGVEWLEKIDETGNRLLAQIAPHALA